MSTSSRRESAQLEALELRLRSCTECGLAGGRTNLVFGVGNPAADLMFVGEAPGFHEDRQGEPFVGQAGRLLTELLGEVGLRREDVYIANVLKCRPPNNRDPLPEEIDSCRPNLYEQVRLIRPRVICTLGRFATRLLANTEAGMSAVRGRVKQVEVGGVPVLIFPVFHPAAALYTPSNKALLQEDFRKLRVLLDRGRSPEEADPPAAASEEEPESAATSEGEPESAAVDSGAGAKQLPLW